MRSLIILLCALSLSGCFGGPDLPDEDYVLDYPAPALAGREQLPEAVKVNKFTPAEAALDVSMVRKSGPNKRETYPAAWWAVHPGYLVTDNLLRDMRRSEFYRAVFSYRDDVPVRFTLGGTVEEFGETAGPSGPQALIVVNVTLLDRSAKQDIAKGVVFQRSFQAGDPLTASSPPALAAAMSRALEKLSRQIQDDVYQAIKARPKPE